MLMAGLAFSLQSLYQPSRNSVPRNEIRLCGAEKAGTKFYRTLNINDFSTT
jgi:hypothetical protein